MSLPQHLVLLGGGSQCLTCSRTSFRSESGLSQPQLGSPWRGQGLESGNLVHPEPGLTLPSTPQSHKAGVGGAGSRQCPFPACHPVTLLPPGPVSPAGHLHVSMAATNLENQLHSAQKNLLFLQREHASTLKGLHAEIRRLQQHCTGVGVGAPATCRGRGRAAGVGGSPRANHNLSSRQLHTGCLQSCARGVRRGFHFPPLGG